jgi:hypothetical protein
MGKGGERREEEIEEVKGMWREIEEETELLPPRFRRVRLIMMGGTVIVHYTICVP